MFIMNVMDSAWRHSPILLPGEEYSSETVYRFFVK